MHQPRRLAAIGLALTLAGLTACSTDAVVATGDRPHRPEAPVTRTVDPETDPAALSIALESLPGYEPPTDLGDGRWERPMADGSGVVTWEVLDGDGAVIPDYAPDEEIAFGDPATYAQLPGVLTFRGNPWRTGGAYGTPAVTEHTLEPVWEQQIGSIRGEGSYWPGAGWTGQPLLVQWPRETKVAMGLAQQFVDDDAFVEVIYPVFEGKIYRFDLATGEPTRPPIEVGWGFKGTASVDPRGYPLLYAGQGLNDTNGTIGPWRWRVFDLIRNEEVWHLSGLDPAAPRADWGAFDSSALVNAETDTVIAPAENGLIYKVKLNSAYDPAAGTVSVDPEVTRLRYAASTSDKFGIENSAVAYRNLMFAADNDGNVFCWDATTLEIVWMVNAGDDTDASLVLDEEADGRVFVYTGNEVDRRGSEGGEHITNIRKLDALTGEQVWQYDIPTYFQAINGGLMGSPMMGSGPTADLVFFNIARTTAPREGTMVALDKASGEVVWRRHLSNYSWSSPVLVTAEDGQQYGVLPDSGGVLHLFDPQTGEDVATLDVADGNNIESTPSVFGDTMVFAGYDAKIHAVRIR
ncbi:PQQ-binding-like beta-propeller repeat protein [Propioniciclava soli]|uniref:PQQ-binding-like beta-propeller repeat protein n=1 Tax=Propioniciclava soli TaxID=2775081 RepID=A0ABZ3CAY8_9ACTN